MEKLALAMSGGVDSSAALLLLKDKYDVSGFTLKLHDRKVVRFCKRYKRRQSYSGEIQDTALSA